MSRRNLENPEVHKILRTEFIPSRNVTLPVNFNPETFPNQITPRQQEILNMVKDGISVKEIAIKLGITEPAVRRHRDIANRRLNREN